MFNWFVSSKITEETQRKIPRPPTLDEETQCKIPKPPTLDYELACDLRKADYNPNHYYHPEGLKQEILQEYECRMVDRKIDELISEIDDVKIQNCDDMIEQLISETEEYIKNVKFVGETGQTGQIEEIENDTKWYPNPAFDSDELLEMESGLRNGIPVEELTEVVVEEPEEIVSEVIQEITIEDMNRIAKEIGEWGSSYDDMPSLESISHDEEDEKVITQNKIEVKEMFSNKNRLQKEHPEGYLEIFMGPMYSGKSTKALFKLSSMADQNFRCLYVNSKKDVRKTESEDDMVSTHNSSYSRPSPKIDCVKVSKLSEVDVKDYEYVAIDELQFFDDAYQNVIDWLNSGKYVIVASLDGDCYRRKFGDVLDLIPHANAVTKLTAYCHICRDNYKTLVPAPFSARMTSDTSAELIGGTDLYKAMCRACHDFHLDVTTSYL